MNPQYVDEAPRPNADELAKVTSTDPKSLLTELDGAIRVLRSGTDFADYEKEVPPIEGNVFAFRRGDNSWHGHLPFKGERLVVQLTYLISAEAAGRKRRNAGVQGMLKRLFERAS